MARTALLGTLAAIVVTWSWLHLEHSENGRDVLVWALLVGVVPALVPRLSLKVVAVAAAGVLAVREALGTASPRGAFERFDDGFAAFYDVGLPFSSLQHPPMHGLIELAVFAFTLAIALAIAARRPLLAAALLVAGAGWPATLLEIDQPFVRGVVILGSALALVAGTSVTPSVRQAVVAGAAIAAAAVAVAGIPAVAKGAFLPWEDWDPYRDDSLPVSVEYVWHANLEALDWPKRKTVVLRIKAPPVSRYWRATTLDEFNGSTWLDGPFSASFEPYPDPLLPRAARNERNLLRARVTVEALRDRHLIAASVPVAYETDFDEILYQDTGTAIVQDGEGVPRGSTYVSLSYAPRPSPKRLARSRPIYPAALDRFLVAQERYDPMALPPFGARDRASQMETILAENPALARYRVMYDEARRIVGATTSPYLAVVRLENHFRRGGVYRYEETPPDAPDGVEPLVDFVTRTRVGHCQHFASAMALMLRYLGIPSRVAAGFTSGRYDQAKGEWVVVDHDAHTWVEVWLRGFGWLPFDPTPGRGSIDGAYTSASAGFSLQAVTAALGAGPNAAPDFNLDRGDPEAGAAAGGRDVPGDVSGVSNEDEPSLFRLLALVAAALAAGVSLLKLVFRRARFFTRDPRRVAAACRRELADFLTDQRFVVPESATLAELGEIVRHEIGLNAENFVAAVEQARYGRLDEAGPAARRARRELRRLERAIRKRLSAWQRTRGLVSLRSFGLT